MAALGGSLSERSGVINIALEGKLITGAFCASVGAYYGGSIYVGALAGVTGGVLVAEIQTECEPDSIEVQPGMALVATVGRGMSHAPGTAARLFGALAEAGINIRMIDQGSSELNIIVGVENSDFARTIQAIYDEFIPPASG